MVHDKEEGQVQTDAGDDVAPTEDIDHDDAEEQPPPVASTATPVL